MPAGDLDRTLAALADPARRGAVELLRRRPYRAGELAAALAVSAPRMSQHLKILRRSGLVEGGAAQDARVRVYRLRAEPFMALRTWAQEVESFWSAQLEAFRQHAERPRPRRRG
ncbi:MAG TPA: metalloregulator ArsR/SmtB family transcription factor [Steroidobacteraceae bacterium]|nr:metalloregulator ArsR/SmtB family transcription factor [Steroidobacteraceae bacterium]